MSTLYQLKTEYLQLLEMAQDPEVDQQAFADTLEGLTGEIEDKCDAYAIVINEVEVEANKFLAESQRCEKHAKSLFSNVDRMKNSLMDLMLTIGKPKVTTEHYKFSVVGNGGVKPLKLTGKVPEEYMIMKPEINNIKIREALENGEALDFAHLEERGKHLSIK